jgi:HAD superfamily hydrolase (TIGR01450 family)
MRSRTGHPFELVIFDIDGVLCSESQAHPEANDVLGKLRALNKKIAYLSNDASATGALRAAELRNLGIDVDARTVFTGLTLASRFLEKRGNPPTLFLGCENHLREEFPHVRLVNSSAAAIVLIGDFFEEYNSAKLAMAYSALRSKADLVAIQKNRFWSNSRLPRIDMGFWVAGLEFCSERKAVVLGKPSRFAYDELLASLGVSPKMALMVSDSIEHDLVTARELGIATVYFDGYATVDNSNVLQVPDRRIQELGQLLSIVE